MQVARALVANTTLRQLDLVSSGISRKGGTRLAWILFVNMTLTELEFMDNDIGTRAARELNTIVARNKKIQANLETNQKVVLEEV